MSRILVTDASVVVDLLARFEPESIEAALFLNGAQLAAPELVDLEVLNTLRKLEAEGAIPRRRRASVIEDFKALRIRRYRHEALRDGVWQRRKNLSAYDASYVVLAGLLGATLVTRDERLARAPRLGIEILVPR
ncbi:MAG: PIN domain-containing protein [Gammaproteobacteria bacterium]|nr:PIN domain-containing protein [Gammaproteobacteria bacterium]